MKRAFQVFGHAVSVWWREFMLFTLFNIAWLALQVTIIAGPPATAAMYLVARKAAAGEYLELGHYWQAMRQMFWPAWRWGAVNLVVLVTLAGNFWYYQSSTSSWVAVLRVVWVTIAVYWSIANLFYWSFWLAQENKDMRTTYRNCVVIIAKRPIFILTLAVLCGALSAVSVLTTLPLAILLMAWLALISLRVVQEELEPNLAM
jgi:uncharacterized membrane protein YesL